MNPTTLTQYNRILDDYKESLIEIGKKSESMSSQEFKNKLEIAHSAMTHDLFQLVLKRLDQIEEKIEVTKKIADEVPF